MPVTMEEIKALGAEASLWLADDGCVRIEFQPGNGTRYDLLVVEPSSQRVGGKPTDAQDERWVVAVMNFGTVYEFGHEAAPYPSYLAEKLTNGNHADAAALHLLLAAMIGHEPNCSLVDAGVGR